MSRQTCQYFINKLFFFWNSEATFILLLPGGQPHPISLSSNLILKHPFLALLWFCKESQGFKVFCFLNSRVSGRLCLQVKCTVLFILHLKKIFLVALRIFHLYRGVWDVLRGIQLPYRGLNQGPLH